MTRRQLWWIAKALEGVGMVVVLAGVFVSISLGLEDDGLSSMQTEMQALLLGGGLFLLGYLIERRIGGR